MDLSTWSGVSAPAREPLEGQYVRLEPLDPDRHTRTLFEASTAEGAEARFQYMAEQPPTDLDIFRAWVGRAAASSDPLYFATIDRDTGRAEGRQALMRIDTANGVVEIGNIVWGAALSRTRKATEALFLFADLAFGLGYRRLEWKCNDENEPSKAAAHRFGFTYEGCFLQHMVVKGLNRDTAWFAITDGDWQTLRPVYQAWLSPDNFDEDGRQHTRLATPHR